MIDLGEASVEPVAEAGPPVPWRTLLAALSVVLLALAGGSAAIVPFPAATVIPARLSDSMFIDGDRLFLVGRGAVATYSLPGGHLVSRTTVLVSGPVSNVVEAGDTLLVS
jgi:hypothetical protein